VYCVILDLHYGVTKMALCTKTTFVYHVLLKIKPIFVERMQLKDSYYHSIDAARLSLGYAARSLRGFLVCTLMFALQQVSLFAQCSELGYVSSVSMKCGAEIMNTKTGELFWAVKGAESLVVGDVIKYDRVTIAGPSACASPSSQIFELTCVSGAPKCTSEFLVEQDAKNPFQFHFSAIGNQPTQHKFTWDFGDGSQPQQGEHVTYEFAQKVSYQVCLQVSDLSNFCQNETCKQVLVTDVNLKNCGKEAFLTAMDLSLMGQLKDLGQGKSMLQEVQWSIQKPFVPIAQSESFSFPLPQHGEYLVCANYRTSLADGSACVAEACTSINAAPTDCHNPTIAQSLNLCSNMFSPVCGCDGNTYGNECEAMLNGVTAWLLGDCKSAQASGCQADFSFEFVSGSMSDGFFVRFRNLSQGVFNNNVLDFGDGSPVMQNATWDTVTHHYSNLGLFLANFSVWKSDLQISSISKIIIADTYSAIHNALPSLGHVWPGDTDNNKKADLADLFNIGLAYYNEGIPRPNAVMAWVPQLAPNWDTQNIQKVNSKHFDGDGNGKINELDVTPIQLFNQRLDNDVATVVAGKPELKVRFLKDTIVVDPNNQATVDIAAELYLGKYTQPVTDLFGLAVALEYPSLINQSSIAFYTGEQFFGQSNQILWLQKNHFGAKQLDLGFVRKHNGGVNGFGRLAQINLQADIIIIIDLIERQSAPVLPITIAPKGIQAIDAQGNPIEISTPAIPDTLYLKILPVTSATDQVDGHQKLRSYPNPVHDVVKVLVPENTHTIHISNSLGMRVRTTHRTDSSSGLEQIPMQDLPQGIYTLTVQTNDRQFSKELIKL
jgi:Secretion system C-terminal sorting domain/PKD domain/Kazal-type serine protease inhibitor domain